MKTQWLVMGALLCMAGAASAAPSYGIISGANISVMATTADGPTPKLMLLNGSEETCPTGGGGLDLGDVNSSLTKESLSLILAARSTNSDIAVGFDDETCIVHTVLLGPAAP